MDLEPFRALLLDRGYRPIRAVSWRRAMILGFSDRADVLQFYGREVRSAARSYPLPAVIRLPGWVERVPVVLAMTRRNVLIRDGYACAYCGSAEPGRPLTIDHVIPRSRGGGNSWDNVVAACGPCNRRKGNRAPEEVGMHLRVVPRAPSALQLGRRGMLVVGDPPPEWSQWL